MVFQPTSPIRLFNLPLSPRNRGKKHNSVQDSDPISQQGGTGLLEKLTLSNMLAHPRSKIRSTSNKPIRSVASNESDQDKGFCVDGMQSEPTCSPVSGNSQQKLNINTDTHNDTSNSTKSSPTDPFYLPNANAGGGRLSRFSGTSQEIANATARPISLAERSFFDSDSDSSSDFESENDEPVVQRASSVRMSKPHIVGQNPIARQRAGYVHRGAFIAEEHLASPTDQSIAEPCNSSPISNDAAPELVQQKVIEDSADALERLEGRRRAGNATGVSFHQIDSASTGNQGGRSRHLEMGPLFSSPVTPTDRISIQRAVSEPVVPPKFASRRKVQIRPSSLIISPTRYSARSLRETVVTTPYPMLDRVDEKLEESEIDDETRITALPRRCITMKSTFSKNDRFPSPDRPEVLFIELGLAGQPCIAITLEIKIADKGVYDDEMLFQQIRDAYHHRLLGVSRLPFCFVRRIKHATSSAAVAYDFRAADFIRHFEHPRIGRKRKTWVIWIRTHSRQHKSENNTQATTSKLPLSASLRTTDKRLSFQSDSSSPANTSFLRPLSIARIPFFTSWNTNSSVLSHHSSSHSSESGSEVVKVEFHHGFSFWTLALLFLWTVFMSIAAVVCWVVFGVPGSNPLDKQHHQGAVGIIGTGLAWNMAAQTRVLTGLVLGMMVAMLGSMIEISLIAGAYILL